MENSMATAQDFVLWLNAYSGLCTETVLMDASPSYSEWLQLFPDGCTDSNQPLSILSMHQYGLANS